MIMHAASLAGLLALLPSATTALTIPPQQVLGSDICPLTPKVPSPDDGLHAALQFVEDDAVRKQQVDRLSRAVQVPTTVNDYMKDPYDEKFAPFVDFQSLLETLFPLTHATARVDHVNRLGLVFTLNGTNPSLKPLLFTAHQDVVPINDASDWTHPPFEGYFDGEWLWGRGASDCKNVLIGLLSVIEDLLSQDWTPARTIVLAFGFDEESHGFLGAGAIATFLEEKWGHGAFEFVLDEGGMGLETLSPSSNSLAQEQQEQEEGGVVYALPGVSEKGSIDLILTLTTSGGHSSVPPPHTGIGILSEIIYTLETQDLFTPVLDDSHPTRKKLECQVAHSPSTVEPWLASALASSDHAALAEQLSLSRGPAVRFTLETSQAADLISGGVKSNALPEKVTALVNYRVALHQTPDVVQDRAIRLIRPIAEKHNLTLIPFPSSSSSSSPFSPSDNDDEKVIKTMIPGDDTDTIPHTLTLTTLSTPLLPAPISPTSPTSKTWTRFAGVTRSVFESVPSLAGKKVVVAGDIMTGNTDTRFYWNLSENIYRWSPSRQGGALNIHTVDERVEMEVHLEAMMLYYDLIRAFDAVDQEEAQHEHDL